MNCGSCKYASGYRSIECRRYPPVLANPDALCEFPVVRADHWCGEYKDKTEQPTAGRKSEVDHD